MADRAMRISLPANTVRRIDGLIDAGRRLLESGRVHSRRRRAAARSGCRTGEPSGPQRAGVGSDRPAVASGTA